MIDIAPLLTSDLAGLVLLFLAGGYGLFMVAYGLIDHTPAFAFIGTVVLVTSFGSLLWIELRAVPTATPAACQPAWWQNENVCKEG